MEHKNQNRSLCSLQLFILPTCGLKADVADVNRCVIGFRRVKHLKPLSFFCHTFNRCSTCSKVSLSLFSSLFLRDAQLVLTALLPIHFPFIPAIAFSAFWKHESLCFLLSEYGLAADTSPMCDMRGSYLFIGEWHKSVAFWLLSLCITDHFGFAANEKQAVVPRTDIQCTWLLQTSGTLTSKVHCWRLCSNPPQTHGSALESHYQ